MLERAFAAAGFRPRIAPRADDADLLQGLVAAGLGVCLLPRLAFTGAGGVRFAATRPSPPARRIVALSRQGAQRRPALAATLDELERSGRASQ